MTHLIDQGLTAFQAKDYQEAAKYWCTAPVISYFDEELTIQVFKTLVEDLGKDLDNEWALILLSALLLDQHSHFNYEEPFEKVYDWAVRAIAINPKNALSQRQAGSALYWVQQPDRALPFYKKSQELQYQPDLQVRIFDIETEISDLSGTSLQIDFSKSQLAGEYYSAGVTLGHLVEQFDEISEINHLKNLQFKSYETSFNLFSDFIINKKGTDFNSDSHTFAMCCNNFGILQRDKKNYQQALDTYLTGVRYSEFIELWQNIKYTSHLLGNKPYEIMASRHIIENYTPDTKLFLNCVHVVVMQLLHEHNAEEALPLINEALDFYQSLSLEEQQDIETVRYYTLLYTHKISAESMLGISKTEAIDTLGILQNQSEEAKDSISLIALGVLYMQKQEYEMALNYFHKAVATAEKEEGQKNLREAHQKRGFLYLYYIKNTALALDDFKKIASDFESDFYTHYYLADCYYRLKQPKVCLAQCEDALKFLNSQVHADKISMAQVYMMQGDSFFDLAKYKKAITAYEESLKFQFIQGVQNNLLLAKEQL